PAIGEVQLCGSTAVQVRVRAGGRQGRIQVVVLPAQDPCVEDEPQPGRGGKPRERARTLLEIFERRVVGPIARQRVGEPECGTAGGPPLSRQLAELPDSGVRRAVGRVDRKSTRLNSSHVAISYAVFCLKKKTNHVSTFTHHA